MYFNILVSTVFGIPTVRRKKQNYLIQTLISLVSNMNQTERDDSLIVVMIAEVNLEYVRNVSVEIKNRQLLPLHTMQITQIKHLLLLNIIGLQYTRCCGLGSLRSYMGKK
uniref:Alpha-1,3-mannosyl-glycoprotein 4-beta-N-acetylglucosaminyltransferase B n=1 Tax=Schizaphis graminum TaxID=13262 RepID=A0A2S2NK94_SCHGA